MVLYKHEWHVRMVGFYTPFPIDMLRYDGCFPDSEMDSSKITNTFYQCKDGWNKEDPNNAIAIKKYWNKNWCPTEERWKSFGWEFIPGSYRKFKS